MKSLTQKAIELMPEKRNPFIIKHNPPSEKALIEYGFNDCRQEVIEKTIPTIMEMFKQELEKLECCWGCDRNNCGGITGLDELLEKLK